MWRFLTAIIASLVLGAAMVTHRNLSKFTLWFTVLECFLALSLTNELNLHCTRVKNNQICELLLSLNFCC